MPLEKRYSDTAVLASAIVKPDCVSSVGVNTMKPYVVAVRNTIVK